MPDSVPILIDLGRNCTIHEQLRKLKLKTYCYPFDNTVSSHEVVVKLLNTDFANIFSDRVEVVCEQTGFKWMHQEHESLSPFIFDKLDRRVSRFRKLREVPNLVFLRYLHIDYNRYADDSVECYNELHQALSNFGFRDFSLYFLVGRKEVDHPYYYNMNGPLPAETDWWGNDNDWRKFALHIAGSEERLQRMQERMQGVQLV